MREEKTYDDLEQAQDLPIDPRVAWQSAAGTIHNLVDAIVELVTNSDDSYRKLLEPQRKGDIRITVWRLKGGRCQKLEVLDFAGGMDKEKLKKGLKFGAESSGFEEGLSVRGFFGRGLKEAILALGKGEIYTIKDDELSRAIVWREGNTVRYRPPKASHKASKEEREEISIAEGNGTLVRINITNEKMTCPDLKTFLPQVRNHYALRDINSATDRRVLLSVVSLHKGSLKEQKPVFYEPPRGEKKFDNTVTLPRCNDNIQIRIYQSDTELDSPRHNPCAQAGLLIKSCDAILDNQLFRYENERAGRFFFGEVVWPNFADRVRSGEALVDFNRGGIEWGHEVCQFLQSTVEEILRPHIEEKKNQLSATPSSPPSEKTSKLNKALCRLLNKLAKEHFSDSPPGPTGKIEDLTVIPRYANIEVNEERAFSIYIPATMVGIGSGPYQAEVKSSNPTHIQVLNPCVILQLHHKWPSLFYGNFRVVGRVDKEEGVITCKFDRYTATANVRVAPPGKIGPRKGEPKGEGGYFHDIRPYLGDNPEQRVWYEEKTRIIWISVKFPGVSSYFENNLNFKSTAIKEAKTMYAELIGEAFCKFAARDDIEKGKIPIMSDSRDAIMDVFITAVNICQKKYVYLIHDAVLRQAL